MGTFTAQHPELLEKSEKDIFFKRFDMIPTLYTLLFTIKDAQKAYEDRMKVGGLGRFATKPEGTPVGFDDPVSTALVRTVHTTYALGFRVTMEMMQDELFHIIDKMPADLGDSARDHMERLAWGLVNDGFNGTTYTGLNDTVSAKSLFNTAHVNVKTGATQSNMLSPAVSLSTTGLESLMTRASIITSDEGRFINQDQDLLVFHPNLQHQVHVLLNTEFKTSSSDNDRSTVVSSRSGITPIDKKGVPYLSSQTAWFLFGGKGKNDLTFNDRMDLDFSRAKDADTFDQKFYAVYRASVMFSEWRNSFGSNA